MRDRVKQLGLVFSLVVFAFCGCGQDDGSRSRLMFSTDSNECKVLNAINGDAAIPNKGFGTVTITHPELMSHFNFTKVLAKFTQVTSEADQQAVVRRMIRSFLVKKVEGIAQEQPLRPFVIPELLCPLMDAAQRAAANFCGPEFFSKQSVAIENAVKFLDANQTLRNFSAIDMMIEPLTFVKRPPRSDLHVTEQVVEARVVYGLRDAAGTERKPATVILEFAGTGNVEFYEDMVKLFIQFKGQNNSNARRRWAEAIETALDRFLEANSEPSGLWQVNQIRVNELAFRGDDILWSFREFQFPSLRANALELKQVPVANTPWIDFAAKDKSLASLDAGFNQFLSEKGLSPESINTDQSIDLFEEFLSGTEAKPTNSMALEKFAENTLGSLKNSNTEAGSKAFAFQSDGTWMSPSALARPGMKFFDSDKNWSKTMKESCQGCHVARSSISSEEAIESTQGFYHVSPRLAGTDASAGLEKAGGNILSNFMLKETQMRFLSVLKLVGCRTAIPPVEEEGGHSQGMNQDLVTNERVLVSLNTFECTHNTNNVQLTLCTSANTAKNFICRSGHTELLRCLSPEGSNWLIECVTGNVRKFARPTLVNSCVLPLPARAM